MASRKELALIRRARSNEAQAQLALGQCYLEGGQGLPRNMQSALYWLDRAASQGEQDAVLLIGRLIPYDVVRASGRSHDVIRWYAQCAESGMPEAASTYAQLTAVRAGPDGQTGHDSLPLHMAETVLGHVPALPSAVAGDAVTPQEMQPELTVPAMAEALAQQYASVQARLAEPHLRFADVEQDLQYLAHAGHQPSQWLLGRIWARMAEDGTPAFRHWGAASYKLALRWLELAGMQGNAAAWYMMAQICRKPAFSQRSMADAYRYLEQAAELGHAQAQYEIGAYLWRKRREDEGNDVLAVSWLQKAIIQRHGKAAGLLPRIAAKASPQAWAQAILDKRTAALTAGHPLLMARLELAAVFGLSKPEALLIAPLQADKGHCLEVDVRHLHPRSRRRLILISTGEERQLLTRVTRLFDGTEGSGAEQEGNYRQRQYRLKTVLAAVQDQS